MGKPAAIRLRGVRQNNLKDLNLDIPLGKFIAVTGLSGAGKSSLVFETLHAEGQRRYVETFSPYTRQFLDLLDRPRVDRIENIPPSIAIQQTNTVRTSRSTVGTMTELCDYFKVWFPHSAELFDPDTGEKIEDDNPQSIWKKSLKQFSGETVLLCFRIPCPAQMNWADILPNLQKQGYTRCITETGEIIRLNTGNILETLAQSTEILVVQDRIRLHAAERSRFIEAASTALHFGQREMFLLNAKAEHLAHYSEGLQSPRTKRRFHPPSPAFFSFNSPVGACPECRGFGRTIEIDYDLAIPDRRLSLKDGAIKPWHGEVYSECQRDLEKFARRSGIPLDIPFNELPEQDRNFILYGESGYGVNGHEWPHAWYGVKGFFDWLETKAYKMHVRVFLSRYRSYRTCPSCNGARLQAEALLWKWQGYTLPDLYLLPISDLLSLLKTKAIPNHSAHGPGHQADIAFDSILSRLRYLEHVGLGYLTLDRSSRTLSGGEVERVNLTTCLGSSLVDTLFVLDEPSVGLHCRDIDRLILVLRRLVDQGNTVVVVEHDESIISAADHVIEVGPKPGEQGGEIVFQGNQQALRRSRKSLTGQYLSSRLTIPPRNNRRPVFEDKPHWAHFRNATKHNLHSLHISLPLKRFVCLSGVSGSGKSTVLRNVIHAGLLRSKGLMAVDCATIDAISCDIPVDDVVLVDQSPISRTPRSNPALYSGGWDAIRKLFANTDHATATGLTASSFSFNAGEGRCEHCQGLGYERVEMQFLSDAFVPCPVCDGQRFKQEVLAISWNGRSIAEVLEMTISEAIDFFTTQSSISSKLQALATVGLGYLRLGQPLNTLSGGESQRLKLVRYLPQLGTRKANEDVHSLLLLDEPTTGLHRDDVRRLIDVFDTLVNEGNSLIVIEHQPDVMKAADWIIELGPEAGAAGGEIVATGPPDRIAGFNTATAPFLQDGGERKSDETTLVAAENPALYGKPKSPSGNNVLEIVGAREHNLNEVNLQIRHQKITVVTGVSGSGKSSLAFDIVFAEGQRRFMESMSPYARQFVEQLPRPDVDRVSGIPPTVAIEQRVSSGGRKSTVATVTEVAQYLRLLFARLGVQHNPATGEPVVSLSSTALTQHLENILQEPKLRRLNHLYLCAPLIRGRKGHHQPIASWMATHGYRLMRADGQLLEPSAFKKLNRYQEHDIEVIVADFGSKAEADDATSKQHVLEEALRLGKGSCFLLHPNGRILSWFSTTRTDPVTGESFPELDPKHFSANSSKGWCPTCRGYGFLVESAADEIGEPGDAFVFEKNGDREPSECPDCHGDRLNPISRAVRLYFKNQPPQSLPELLQMNAPGLVACLRDLDLDKRGTAIATDIIPQVEERLRFLDEVGLGYLTLDRSVQTLSGGEVQRIRLAAQLGSNLSGVLYVLDEPSIGLHARDNDRLIEALKSLRQKGNTLVIVEHDEDTMRAADRVIDLGPGAGVHGGNVLAEGSVRSLLQNRDSTTGRYLKEGMRHPLRDEGYRRLPGAPKNGSRKVSEDWLVLREARLRNLKGDDLFLPPGKLIMVCGVSGAGKSTLVHDLLLPAITEASRRNISRMRSANRISETYRELFNGNLFKQVIEVDQSPIGKTPRSTPATYIGAFDLIRQIFATLPEAKVHGYGPGTFSFNTKGGRCEACQGAGRVKLEMNFLPDAYLPCDECGGRRYAPELLSVTWNGKSIADVLGLTFEEAVTFFDFHGKISAVCRLMVDTGLGYLTLGQSSPTLSGGEAQRLKLVAELARGTGNTHEPDAGTGHRRLYVLEEPTIGLHFADCEKLVRVLHRLVDHGHTVIVIEHNLDLIAEADYLVEIGPEGGEAGGHILYQGDVKGLVQKHNTPTAAFLQKHLSRHSGSTTAKTRPNRNKARVKAGR